MLAGVVARGRSLWRGLRRRAEVEAEMQEEFRLHLELRAESLVRSGLSPAEAKRRARLEFGSMEQYKEEGRESRGLRAIDEIRFSWLDFKLGFRMLVRYPGLTLIGGLAMAFAIAMGAATFEFLGQVVRPKLPLEEGDRIVAIRHWDAAVGQADSPKLHDFVRWRDEIRTLENLGAYRALDRNLATDDGRSEPVEVAEITASAFQLTRVPPLLGRTLVEEDERQGAPAVAVIGYDVWQTRFTGDPKVVGRTLRLGNALSTVVGVMPQDYAFPVFHSVWVPLRLNVLHSERGRGPHVTRVFGRLEPGVSLDEAKAELDTLGVRAAADFPDTHAHLRVQVLPYPRSILNVSGWTAVGLLSVNVFLILFLVLVCGNVALLMFARAATRESEIVMRSALGASRGRIVMQLLAEALVLGGVAAVAGLAAAGLGLRWAMGTLEAMEGKFPFWFSDSLAPSTVLYASGLTVLGAVVAGVLPAFKMTRRGMETRLRQATVGRPGLRFGGLWTAVIVIQVAVTVAFPVTSFFMRRDAVQLRSFDVGFAAEEYLSVRLETDRETAPDTPAETSRTRLRTTYRELERRLAAEAGVRGVTFGSRLPGMYHPWRRIEVDAGGAASPDSGLGHRVSAAWIDVDYFDVLGTPVLSGRGFHSSDPESGQRVVIVNQAFVHGVLEDRNPLGRRLRYLDSEESSPAPVNPQPGPWYEIVGVVKDLGMTTGGDPTFSGAGLYHPLALGTANPVYLAAHVKGDPVSFTGRLRALATAVDPTLRLYALQPMDEIQQAELRWLSLWFRLTVLLSSIALLLSLAGIYAVMSFTVSRRTREIGIRLALGADRRRVIAAIFHRPLAQVGSGVIAGAALTAALAFLVLRAQLWPKGAALVMAYAGLMMAVCMLACIVPTRRALRVEPTEALRADG
jgi:putative ABC transport system permease protein